MSSYRSQAAPGDRQGRNANSRYKTAIRTKRTEEARRASIHEIGDARRATVYRTDVEFAPEDGPVKLPERGSRERQALLGRVASLRAQGLSHLRIGNALDPQLSAATVALLLKEIKGSEK